MGYYERVASRELADDFYAVLRRFMLDAAERLESFSVHGRDLRRVHLHRFPYHFLFRVLGDVVRNLVVRHHRQHRSSGIHRRWTGAFPLMYSHRSMGGSS